MTDMISQFDKEEMDIIAQAQREQAEADAAMLKAAEAVDEAETKAEKPEVEADTKAATPPETTAPAEVDTATAVPAETAPAETGDLRAALRAARRNERHLKRELDRVRQDLERQAPAPAPASKKPDESVMRDVEAYAAPAAEYIKDLEAKYEELSKKVVNVPPAATEPVFMPEVIHDAQLQDVVDQIDDLSNWQHSAQHQRLWNAAKKMDDLLTDSPAWQGKPDKERLEEVVRRVKGEFVVGGTPPAPKKVPATAQDAARVIEATKASAAPVALGDLRGGVTPDHSTLPDYHQMVKNGATDEEIIASLGRG